ncbi:hypothetical protein RJ639_027234 [Escallonia herrerae]|uniref:Folylpolyglutamate synthase n=1 Tax=Escallonia herrerae TaxID=1293975 RepID=A0AA89BG50_9ASTE|nr:hypothetical protein RJ639_027234 [Escallonia herrerae]
MVSCLRSCEDPPDLINLKRLHSEAKIRHKPKEKVGSTVLIIEEDLQALPLSPAYESAMEALSSLITHQKRGKKSDIGGKYKKLDRMSMYTKILGLEEYIAGLKIIHVAGTKGKVGNIRRKFFTVFLGLLEPVEGKCFRGLANASAVPVPYSTGSKNICMRKGGVAGLRVGVGWHFLRSEERFEMVDVAIVEVGLGGKKDSTNVIKEPVVCGIASLGMDHVEVLGDTLGKIASHKAGIFKPQVPAFTVPQLSEAMDVLQERAQELMYLLNADGSWEITFSVLDMDTLAPGPGISHHLAFLWDNKASEQARLPRSPYNFRIVWRKTIVLVRGMRILRSAAPLQFVSDSFRETASQRDCREDNFPEPFVKGLSTARLSGRAQIVHDVSSRTDNSSEVSNNSSGGLIFYLDGAHSPESMEPCARWFLSAVKENRNQSPVSSSSQGGNQEKLWGNGYVQHGREKESQITSKQILLFNCMEVRDPQILLLKLVNTCGSSGSHFSKAIFVPSMSTYNKVTSGASFNPSDITTKDLSWQFNLQRIWEKIIHGSGNLLHLNANRKASLLYCHKRYQGGDLPNHPEANTKLCLCFKDDKAVAKKIVSGTPAPQETKYFKRRKMPFLTRVPSRRSLNSHHPVNFFMRIFLIAVLPMDILVAAQ